MDFASRLFEVYDAADVLETWYRNIGSYSGPTASESLQEAFSQKA